MEQATVIRTLMRERAKLLAFIWAIVRDEHTAEDVVQDVMALALETCGDIPSEPHLMGWARKAARFKALRVLEKRGTRPLALDDDVLELPEAEWDRLGRADTHAAVDSLRACLSRLSPRADRLIQLRYAEGLKSGEIARRLKRSTASVYVALSRVHRALAGCIGREHPPSAVVRAPAAFRVESGSRFRLDAGQLAARVPPPAAAAPASTSAPAPSPRL